MTTRLAPAARPLSRSSSPGPFRGVSRALVRLAAILAFCWLASPAVAQDDSRAEMRRRLVEALADNERLAMENAALLEQLAALRAERDALLARSGPADAAEAPPPAPASPTGEEELINIGSGFDTPQAILLELRTLYQTELVDPMDPALNPSSPTSGTSTQEQRAEEARIQFAVRRWCRDVPRRMQRDVTWVVRMAEPRSVGDGDYRTRVQIIQLRSGEPIGTPFILEVPRRFALDIDEDARPGGLWELDLTITAAPGYDPERATPGPLDYPPFVGRYAYFSYEIFWKDVRPHAPTPPAPLPAGADVDPQLREIINRPAAS